MTDKRQLIPLGGLAAIMALVVYAVVQLSAQGAAAVTGDFRNAVTAEVRDQGNQVILRGQFALAEEEDNDTERKAKLESTGVDADAAGEAEIEFDTDAPGVQEVEFSVRNLEPGTALTFVIDGTTVATATADKKGEAEVELDVKLPGGK
jgi:hypothetical protein